MKHCLVNIRKTIAPRPLPRAGHLLLLKTSSPSVVIRVERGVTRFQPEISCGEATNYSDYSTSIARIAITVIILPIYFKGANLNQN